MSSFVVSPEVINNIAPLFYEGEYRRTEHVTRFGQQLIDLNVQSVNANYPDHPPEESYSFRYNATPVKDMQRLRHLECWMYQSDNGGCHLHDLYKQATQIADRLRCQILRTLPEYQATSYA
ncbi:MAG: hypothetical protein GY903_01060 [Fuerstiella sp.]|nr:hypothetical protein [Fuerstiella sp.]MCP4853067.1 hypothetical protein [Fuerstiella sp.]